MKKLNALISVYTRELQQGEIQLAYKGIMAFMGRLRSDLIKRFPDHDISGLYQGYMDMSYLSICPAEYKEKGLKIALVYLHEKGCFEVWLSARNREISERYAHFFSVKDFEGLKVFHDVENLDAIIECTLESAPDFEAPEDLIEKLEQGIQQFIRGINS